MTGKEGLSRTFSTKNESSKRLLSFFAVMHHHPQKKRGLNGAFVEKQGPNPYHDAGGGMMNCSKIGRLISALRKEKNMTQKALAEKLNLSDRTISKWERGMGCPDVSVLKELSHVLGVPIEKILTGALDPNETNGGNMRNVTFYVCAACGNVMFSTSEADISCCGRKLAALKATAQLAEHDMKIEEIENDYFITIDHGMSKAHHISFVAHIGYARTMLHKLYPEQNAELRFPKLPGTKLVAYCTQHGLWEIKMRGCKIQSPKP